MPFESNTLLRSSTCNAGDGDLFAKSECVMLPCLPSQMPESSAIRPNTAAARTVFVFIPAREVSRLQHQYWPYKSSRGGASFVGRRTFSPAGIHRGNDIETGAARRHRVVIRRLGGDFRHQGVRTTARV